MNEDGSRQTDSGQPAFQPTTMVRDRSKKENFLRIAAGAANVILVGAGTLCLGILLYFVYHYSWTGQRQFSSWTGVLVDYIAPALLASLFFASLRLRRSHRINIVLIVCSVGISVYLAEIAAVVWFRLPSVRERAFQEMMASAAAAAGSDFDSRSKLEVIQDLRSQGIDAGPSIHSRALLRRGYDGVLKSVINLNGVEALPLASISNRLTVVCNETGEFLTYTSDKHGFKNPPNIWDRDAIDIAVVGDSFVQGYCVPPEDDFVSEIRRRYPATLNLGIESNGPFSELATLKEYAAIFRPKIVLWFYFEANDQADLNIEKDNALLRRYLTNGFRQGLMERQAEIDRALSDFIEPSIQKSDLSRALDEVYTTAWEFSRRPRALERILKLAELRSRFGLVGMPGPDESIVPVDDLPASRIPQLYDVLLEANRSTAEWGGRVYFVYLPAGARYGPGDGPSPNRGGILQSAQDAGLSIVDLHPAFSALEDPLALFPFRMGEHYTAEGHRLVGQEVLRAISQENEAEGISLAGTESRTN